MVTILVMNMNYTDKMEASVDPDQTASYKSSLILVCTVCISVLDDIL